MLILASKLKDVPILSLTGGNQIAQVVGPIVDYKNLEVPALWCSSQSSKDRTLNTNDIREFNPGVVLVNSEDNLSEPDEVVRLAPLIQDNLNLVGMTVRTESGTKLGRVTDFTINTQDSLVHKLYVRQPLLKSMVNANVIIDRSQIVDVSPRQITVRDATVMEPLAAGAPVIPE